MLGLKAQVNRQNEPGGEEMTKTSIAHWRLKSICAWSALAGCALYARHVAASPNWLASHQRAEISIALIYVGLPVLCGLGVCWLRRAYLWLRARGPGAPRPVKGVISA
jgi:hypothetical protein